MYEDISPQDIQVHKPCMSETQLKRRLIASCGEIQFLDRAKYPPFLVKTPIQGSQEMTEHLARRFA